MSKKGLPKKIDLYINKKIIIFSATLINREEREKKGVKKKKRMTEKSISRRYVYCIQPRRQRFHGREEEAPDYRRVRHDGERCRVRRGGKDEVRALEKNFLINVASPPLSFNFSIVSCSRVSYNQIGGVWKDNPTGIPLTWRWDIYEKTPILESVYVVSGQAN